MPLAEAVAPLKPNDGIVVEGIDDATWSTTAPSDETSAEASPEGQTDHAPAFTSEGYVPEGTKQYKLLTQKDKFFAGKFEIGRLEDAINHYARQGWIVRGLATPLVTGFSGGPKEEIVVLLER